MRLQDQAIELIEVLRAGAESYPQQVFPGPPTSTTPDGIAGAALRNVAAPKYLEAAAMIEMLLESLQDVALNYVLVQEGRCPNCGFGVPPFSGKPR